MNLSNKPKHKHRLTCGPLDQVQFIRKGKTSRTPGILLPVLVLRSSNQAKKDPMVKFNSQDKSNFGGKDE